MARFAPAEMSALLRSELNAAEYVVDFKRMNITPFCTVDKWRAISRVDGVELVEISKTENVIAGSERANYSYVFSVMGKKVFTASYFSRNRDENIDKKLPEYVQDILRLMDGKKGAAPMISDYDVAMQMLRARIVQRRFGRNK